MGWQNLIRVSGVFLGLSRNAGSDAERSVEKSAESAENLSRRQKDILSIMEGRKEYRAEEIAELVGLKGSRTRQLLKELVEMQKIHATADTKMRRYIKAE